MNDLISRGEAMAFPKTWKEFEEKYGFTDEDETYTNGARLIPSFRAEQWLEHIARPKGKWIRITQGADPEKYLCPFCHRTVEEYGPEGFVPIRYPYCHCGADMRGERDDDK